MFGTWATKLLEGVLSFLWASSDCSMKRKKLTPNFYEDEFACKCGCGLNGINRELVNLLQKLREDFNSPMVVTSGLRCPEWNTKSKGSSNSSHLWGEAVDIGITDGMMRYKFVQKAQKHFQRIGIAKTFVHIDVENMKTNPVIWTY